MPDLSLILIIDEETSGLKNMESSLGLQKSIFNRLRRHYDGNGDMTAATSFNFDKSNQVPIKKVALSSFRVRTTLTIIDAMPTKISAQQTCQLKTTTLTSSCQAVSLELRNDGQ